MFTTDEPETKQDKSTSISECNKNGSTHHFGKLIHCEMTFLYYDLVIVMDSTHVDIILHASLHAGIPSVILVPVLTASHLFLSLCTLVIGLLLGSLSHRCRSIKKSSTNTKLPSSPEEPVYSEISPKAVPSVYHTSVKSVDNVVYGQVSP